MEVISRIWRLYETRVGIELLGQLKTASLLKGDIAVKVYVIDCDFRKMFLMVVFTLSTLALASGQVELFNLKSFV